MRVPEVPVGRGQRRLTRSSLPIGVLAPSRRTGHSALVALMTKPGTARGSIALLLLLSFSFFNGCRDSSPAGVVQASAATSEGSSSSSTGSTTLSSTLVEDGPSPTNFARVAVDLGHCGVGYIAWDGRVWRVVDSPFQDTNAEDDPVAATFVGEGTILQIDADHLRYTDDSGIVLAFVPEPEPRTICS